MTDRELLELAAKAAGIEVWPGAGFQAHVLFTRPDLADPSGKVTGVAWNPLQDDGQALRLAVSLGIDMYFWVSGVEAQHSDIPQQPIQHYKGDRAAATRRAVTLVAADIGKTRSD